MKDAYKFLRNAIERHFKETGLLISQLNDQEDILRSKPVHSGRPLGEIILHMIRSFEFYLRGLTTDHWEPLHYDLDTYSSVEEVQRLYNDAITKAKNYLERLSLDSLNDTINIFNRPANRLEILLEMLEHSIQHRGQILVYFRLIGLEPAKIPYII